MTTSKGAETVSRRTALADPSRSPSSRATTGVIPMRNHHRRSTFVLAAALALVGAFALGRPLPNAAAQDATPAPATGPATLPVVPDPALCTTAPRPIAAYEAFLGTPAPTAPEPVVITAGAPADQATVDAVIATMIQQAACTNAYGFGGHSGVYTDAGFAEDNAGIDQETVDFFKSPENKAMFDDEANWHGIFAVSLVQVLADGRVAAVVQFQTDGAGGADLMIFAEEDGRYLIDHWVDGPFDIAPDFSAFEEETTPAASTPTA
jgi:hypothetical protein